MRKSFLGLRLNGWIELLALIAIILSIDVLLFDGNRFRDIAPHPFWIPLLLLTVQYGTGAGLIAATIMTFALYIGDLPPQGIDQDFYAYFFELFGTSILWLVCAVLIGGIRDRQVTERAELRVELRQSKREAAKIAESYEKLKNAKAVLEQRLAGQLKTTATLYKGAREIERNTEEEVLDGFDDLFSAIMDAEVYSIFLLDTDRLKMCRAVGWDDSGTYRTEYDNDTPLFKELIGNRRTLALNDPWARQVLQTHGLVAGPVRDPKTNAILGIIKIEKMPFVALDFEAIDRFEIICDWIGASLARARVFEDFEQGQLTKDGVILSAAAYRHQCQFLSQLVQRKSIVASVILIRVRTPETNDSWLDQVGMIIAQAANEVLRTTDQVFEANRDGTIFAVLMPGASQEQANSLMTKLRYDIRPRKTSIKPQPQLSYSVKIMGECDAVEYYGKPE